MGLLPTEMSGTSVVQFHKISINSHGRFFSSSALHFSSTFLAFKTPSPWEFPVTFYGEGMDFFLELYTVIAA